MFSQENQCLCPLSPDDSLKIRTKNECTPVKRTKKMKLQKIGIKAMPFPPISEEPKIPGNAPEKSKGYLKMSDLEAQEVRRKL